MAWFYGHAPDYVPNEEREYIINPNEQTVDHEVIVSNEQASQAAFFVCQEIISEVKNLWIEVALFKQLINNLKETGY